jgi:putative hydrolase of the HAD superfamily
MLKLILFDAAGTLFHPRELIGASYARIARKYGVKASTAEVSGAFRRVFRDAPGLAFDGGRSAAELSELEYQWWHNLVAACFAGLGRFTDFDSYFKELFEFFADPSNWRLMPDTEVTLTRLREQGLELGIVSNFDFRLYRLLEGLGIARHFSSITISSEAGYAKPSPEIFKIALERHRVGAAESLHVGDSEPLDIRGATAAGIASVLVSPESGMPPRFEERHARVSSIAAVLDAVVRMTNRCL